MTSRAPRRGARPAVVVFAALVLACSGSGGSKTDPFDPGSGPWAFRASLIDPALILWITPLGNMSPSGHWLPTDHIYFGVADPKLGQSPVARRTAYFAPADGILIDVIPHPPLPDVKVQIRVTTTIDYYIDHLIPDVPLARGTRITAGQRVGTTGSVYAIDLGVIHADHRLPPEYGVARFTFHSGGDVIERLARCVHAVMAGRAAALDFLVIEVAGRLPRNRGVAGIAAIRAQHVILRLHGGGNARSTAVAGGAIARRAFEDGAHVTGLARDVQVRAQQFEPGGEVIEFRRSNLRRTRPDAQQAEHQGHGKIE